MKVTCSVSGYCRHKSFAVNTTLPATEHSVNIDELLRDDQNFISHVVEDRDSDNIKF